MLKFETAYEAAKHFAKEQGEYDLFKESMIDYIDSLVDKEKLWYVHDVGYKGSVAWCIENLSAWYAFDDGERIAGPRDTKASVMEIINEDRGKRLDTGIYRGSDTGAIIARLGDYRSWYESCSSKGEQ